MHQLPSESKLFFKIFRTHVRITCHQPRISRDFCLPYHCLQQGLIPRVHPSVCQKYTEKTRKSPLTFTHAWAILTATKIPPDVCFRASLLALSSVILAASAASLHLSLASLLNCSSISSFLSLFYPKEDIALPFVSPHVLFPCSMPTQQGGPQSSCFFLHFHSVLPFSLLPPFWGSSTHLPSFICASCCIPITAPVLLCGSSAAALTH